MPDFYSDPSPQTPETAPSALASDEMSFPRLIGTIGLGLAAVGAFAIVLNISKERLIGPTSGAFFIFIGIVAMLYHAARDGDQLVRRAYLGLGFGALIAGIVLGLIPQPKMGDWLMPWGGMGLLTGVFFLIAAGRHEAEAPFDGITTGVLTLGGMILAAVGLVGTALSVALVPRFASLATLGLLFWWAALGRLGPASETGYRFGRILGWVGLAALVYGVAVSIISSERFFMPRGLMLISLGLLYWMLAFAMTSDRPIAAMTRRELAAYFYSPIAYIVLFGTAFIAWLGYFVLIERLMQMSNNGMGPIREPVVQFYAADFFAAVGVMFVVPVITMRLLSEERRTGTIEVLLTGPVNEWQVVLSKFFAGLLFFLTLSVPWGLFLIPVYVLGRTGFDYLPLLSYYIALVCTGASFISMGLFFSSLTRNQIIAAVLTFAGMFLFLALLFVQDQPNLSPTVRAICEQMSFYNVWLKALSGRLPVHQLITFLSISAFWLYLTTKVLEARKWS